MAQTNHVNVLHRTLLYIIHFFFSVALTVKCLLPRKAPKALTSQRRASPGHVALLLHVDPADAQRGDVIPDMIECARRVMEWRYTMGFNTLTVYDEQGVLKQQEDSIVQAVAGTCRASTSAPAVLSTAPNTSYPMTPPPSDGETTTTESSISSAEPISPVIRLTYAPQDRRHESESSAVQNDLRQRRNARPNRVSSSTSPLKVNIICRDQGKRAIAQAAQQLALQNQPVTSEAISAILAAELPEPDLLLVHPLLYPSTPSALSLRPLELYGFPPWQVRLTEIWYDPLPPRRYISLLFGRVDTSIITEVDFRRALDQFAKVEQKIGK